jgi:transcription factor 1
VHVLPHSAFVWEAYDEIRDLGLLHDVAAEDWKTGMYATADVYMNLSLLAAPHSTLSFIGHLPLGQVGEQLIAQLFRTIPERSWLFKFGRMRMSWLLSKRMLDVSSFFWYGLYI